jgi:hypothetical protein
LPDGGVAEGEAYEEDDERGSDGVEGEFAERHSGRKGDEDGRR